MIQLPAPNRTVSSEYYASTASPVNLVGKLLPKIQEVFRIHAKNARSKTELAYNQNPPSPPKSTVNSPNRSFYQLIQVSPENALQREAKGQTRGDRARFLQSFLTEGTDPSHTPPLPSRLSPSSSEATGPGGRRPPGRPPAALPAQRSPSRFPPPSPRSPRRSPRRGVGTPQALGGRRRGTPGTPTLTVQGTPPFSSASGPGAAPPHGRAAAAAVRGRPGAEAIRPSLPPSFLPAPAGPWSVKQWPWQPASRSPRWGRRRRRGSRQPPAFPPAA